MLIALVNLFEINLNKSKLFVNYLLT